MRNHAALVSQVCLLLATGLLAQVVITSSIVGTVTDPQKAVIAGAAVTLTNTDTGVEWTATTDTSGDYQFPNLIAGNYRVAVVGEGFAKAVSTAVPLENGTTRRVNITLTVGRVAEVVAVTSAASLVKTDDANVSEVIQNKFVRDLPIEGRSFLNYAQIVPMFNSGTGDNTRTAWGLASATSTGAKQLNVGGTEYGVGYYIDGLNNNDNWVEGPVTNVNMDAVQEVKAEVVDYSAEYGRDVGQISLTTKSGTNQLHGSAYDFFQNAGLNANDPYSILTQVPRSSYHQNQYGFTVGGPVYIPKLFDGKNKMFFFVSFEQLRNRSQHQFTAYVPTDAERAGDFSAWITGANAVDVSQCDGSDSSPAGCRYVIYDPSTYNPATQTRQLFPGNIIPNPDPKALAYLSHFPEPNGYTSPIPGVFDNWSGSTTDGINDNNYSARVDYNLTHRDSLYFRFSHDYGTKLSEGGLVPELALGNGPVHTTDSYQGHWVHAFGSTFTNEVNFSVTRAQNASNQAAQINKFMQATWLPDLFQNTSTGGAGFTPYDLQQLGIKNDATFSVSFADPQFQYLSLGTTEYWYQWVPIYQLSDSAAKVIKRHTLKFGFYWQRRDERDNDVIRSLNIGGYCSGCGEATNYTGRGPLSNDGSGWNTLAEFETGAVANMNQRTPLTGGDGSLWFRMPEYSAYFNDTWNATQKLSVNLGLRYDVGVPAYSVDNYWGVMDLSYPGYRLVMPGLTPGTHNPPYPADKNNFAPRIGLAYRLTDKTVVRAGYGMFYETGRFKFLDQMFWSSPGYGGVTYDSTTYASDPNQTYFTLNDAFPAAVSIPKGTWPVPIGEQGGELYGRQSPQTIDSDSAITPYIQRWSLDVQRELGKAVVATVGYVGSEGTKLTTQYDLNLPPQGVYLNSDEYYDARPLTSVAPERWDSIWAVHHNRSNNYHALTTQLKTQQWHGLTSIINYTWSKQMDTFFGESGESGVQAIGGQWHPEWSYGPSDANHTHRFVAALLYELPGKNLSNRFLREAVGGWQLNTITTFESGSPVTVFNGYTSSFDYMGDVPDQTCNANLSGGDRIFSHYFNTDCYTEPPPDPVTGIATHRGNERRNNLQGPGINNWDMSLGKSFPLFGEGRQVQVRAEAFNVFNHTQWSSIATPDIGCACVVDDRQVNPDSQFGYVTGARPGRHMQVALKFVF
ncbi:MAG TPA: TonB-dependent receptor [Terriglobales bacterium]|nr:TonB-dependent receptor [Terriglobales bacterium]